jgi:hypothetical protein
VGVAALLAVVAVVALTRPDPDNGGDPTTPTNVADTTPTTPTESKTTPTATEPTTSVPSRAEAYLAEANAICANHRAEILTAFSNFSSSGDPSGVIPPLQSLQADLQALGTPVAEGTDTYMDDLDRWIKAFLEGDVAGAQIWQSAMEPHSREAGLTKCPPN